MARPNLKSLVKVRKAPKMMKGEPPIPDGTMRPSAMGKRQFVPMDKAQIPDPGDSPPRKGYK